MIRETKKPKERKAKKGVEATAPTKRPPFHKPLADVWSAGFKHYNNGQIYRFNPKFDPVNVSLIAEAMEITGEPTADHIAEFKAAVNRYFRDRQWPAEPTLHGFCKDLSRRFVDSAPTLPGLPPDTPPAPPKPPPKHSPHVSEDFESFRTAPVPWPQRGPILKE